MESRYESGDSKLVGQALNKAADQVHEYEAIDYIQSLNNEGHYADFRYFMEALRTQLNATSKSVRDVTIESVDENNQARLEGLPLGIICWMRHRLLERIRLTPYVW